MSSIEMGGYDVVLGEEWLRNLGLVTMKLKDLYIKFTKEGHKHHLKGITLGCLETITFHCMDKLFNKGHSCIITQVNAIQVVDTPSQDMHQDLKIVLSKHQQKI